MENQPSLVQLITEARKAGFTHDVEHDSGKYFRHGKLLADAEVTHSHEWHCQYTDSRVIVECITAGALQAIALIY